MFELMSDIKKYYSHRAPEYEKIYSKPERQKDLGELKSLVKKILKGKTIIEVACGTGYWTGIISTAAHSITAIDSGEEVLNIARSKSYKNNNTEFRVEDAFPLSGIQTSFNAAFCGFWLSHIELNKTDSFLKNLHTKLKPGSVVVMIDNNFVEGSSTSISRTDDKGNSYQVRNLEDSSKYEIIKNFYSEEELKRLFSKYSSEVEVINLEYYWLIKYII